MSKKIISAFHSDEHTGDDEEVDVEVSLKDGMLRIWSMGYGALVLNLREAISLHDAIQTYITEVQE
jgi:hypothetical protein